MKEFQLSPRAIENAERMLPEHMIGAVVRYFDKHLPPGDFLTAVLSNDLVEAVSRADDINRQALPQYIIWLYNNVPGRPNGWGSPEAVEKWLAHETVDA